jgi:hypothetical protein
MKNKDGEPDLLESYTLEEVKDDVIGKKGTTDRDAYESQLQRDLMEEARKRTPKRKWTT